MKILVSFEADSAEQLRAQMEAFLGPKPELQPEPQKAEPAPAKTKAKARAPEPQKAAEPEVELEPEPSEPPQKEEEQPVDDRARAAVDLLKLKNEQLERLRDLFRAGKGPLVRQLLQKYGEGAKVFPEVDAKHFAKIKVELDRELGAWHGTTAPTGEGR